MAPAGGGDATDRLKRTVFTFIWTLRTFFFSLLTMSAEGKCDRKFPDNSRHSSAETIQQLNFKATKIKKKLLRCCTT